MWPSIYVFLRDALIRALQSVVRGRAGHTQEATRARPFGQRIGLCASQRKLTILYNSTYYLTYCFCIVFVIFENHAIAHRCDHSSGGDLPWHIFSHRKLFEQIYCALLDYTEL